MGPPVLPATLAQSATVIGLNLPSAAAVGVRAAVPLAGDLPKLGGAAAAVALDLAHGLDHGHCPGEGRAAPPGEERETERAGVTDDRAHLLVGDAELVGRHHGQRGAKATDVG